MLSIDGQGIYYRALNRQINVALGRNVKRLVLTNILGQRYIGCGLNQRAVIEIFGTPGQDLGAFMNGPELIVHGNAQDGVGNTMNEGKIIVQGKAGEIPGHSMRGGKVFIRGDVEYRAAIHMKEYMDQIPWLIIGGTAKDYCGEYMAGGRVIVLDLENGEGSPVGNGVGTGIHGGVIYVRGKVDIHQLGIGAVFADMEDEDREFLRKALDEYGKDMELDLSGIFFDQFVKITKRGKRPFASLYTPSMNLKTKHPVHIDLTPPCADACPTGIPTPVYLNLIKDGKVKEAQLLMDEYTPFRMSVCGSVCPAPCMDACSRGAIDGPLDIGELARTYYPDFKPKVSRKKKNELISIIGAGPAGLSAAWQLARRGYSVEVFDAAKELGGKVRNAIPRERLDGKTLDRDIARIKSLPIGFKLSSVMDIESMKSVYRASDAVVIATGAQVTKRIEYPGGEGILSGLSFLMDIIEGKPMDLKKKKVLVIGAGNVGMDIACESWRMGASKVTAVDIQEPLAFGKELEAAVAKGTEILWPRYIERIEDKKVFFSDGTSMEADVIFFSIGEIPETSFIPDSVFIDDRGYLKTADDSCRSSDPKVYGCGDIVRPGLISDAIAAGRQTAMEIHATLIGEEYKAAVKNPVPKRCIRNVYFGEEQNEIDRCISCGTCIFCDKCIEQCPQEALSRNGEVFTVDTALCTMCYTCVSVCPRGAVQPEDFFEEPRVLKKA